jgi:hypothetical protein
MSVATFDDFFGHETQTVEDGLSFARYCFRAFDRSDLLAEKK